MLEKLYNAFTKVDLAAGNQVRDGSYCLFAVSITKYVILFVIQNISSSLIGFLILWPILHNHQALTKFETEWFQCYYPLVDVSHRRQLGDNIKLWTTA